MGFWLQLHGLGSQEPRFSSFPVQDPSTDDPSHAAMISSPPRKKRNQNPSLSPRRKASLEAPYWWRSVYDDPGKPAASKDAKDGDAFRQESNRFAALQQSDDESEDGDYYMQQPDDDSNSTEDDADADALDANQNNNEAEESKNELEGDESDDVPDYNHDRVVISELSTAIRDRFQSYCEAAPRKLLPYLKDNEKLGIELIDLLIKEKAPLDAYRKAMLWHFTYSNVLRKNEKLQDTDLYIGRETLMKQLMNRYDMMNKIPKIKSVILPYTGTKVDLVCYDVEGQIESLLTDPRIKDSNYLFYGDDPTATPPTLVGDYGEINTGLAYTEAVRKYKKEPNHVILPIIIYTDATNTGQMKDLPIQEVKITLGIFNREYRDKPQAWRSIGNIAAITKNMSKARKRLKESRHAAATASASGAASGEGQGGGYVSSGPSRDFHAMLDAILEGYLKLQGKGIMWDLRYKGKTWKGLVFIPFLLFIKCDTKEADLLCGKYTTYSGGVQCLCRYCCCFTEDSDNPEARYDFKTVPMIKRLVDNGELSALRSLSQQYIQNAFYKLRFSPVNDRGIHGACPLEMLHAILLGIFMYNRDTFYDQIGPSSKAAELVDELSQLFGMQFARQSERNMPNCHFSNGIREGKLNAKEYPGVLLVMATILHSTDGKNIFYKSSKMPPEKIHDWTYLLEVVLCWYAFLSQPVIPREQMMHLALRNRLIMWLIKKTAFRKEGMGLKLMKYHAISHIAWDIRLFGVPLNYDTGADESGHKATKVAAKMTQRNQSTFAFQTATRETEFHVANMAIEELMHDNKPWDYFDREEFHDARLVITDEAAESATTGGTIINIFVDEESDRVVYSLGTGKQSRKPAPQKWNYQVLKFLHDLQEKVGKWTGGKLIVRSDHKRKGIIYRGHPNYRSSGEAWSDWVVVDWGGSAGELPSQIWCFVVLDGLPKSKKKQDKHKDRLNHGHCSLKDGVYAVVERSRYIPRPVEWNQNPEVLFKRLGLETGPNQRREFYLVNVEAFKGPCCVIADYGAEDLTTYFEIANREKWPGIFYDWMKKPVPAAYQQDPEGRQFHK